MIQVYQIMYTNRQKRYRIMAFEKLCRLCNQMWIGWLNVMKKASAYIKKKCNKIGYYVLSFSLLLSLPPFQYLLVAHFTKIYKSVNWIATTRTVVDVTTATALKPSCQNWMAPEEWLKNMLHFTKHCWSLLHIFFWHKLFAFVCGCKWMKQFNEWIFVLCHFFLFLLVCGYVLIILIAQC